MDNDVDCSVSSSSEESASDEYFHDSIEARKDNRESSDIDNDETRKSNAYPQPVLDLRNVPPISDIVKCDDETSEKLSAVIEQPEEQVTSEIVTNEETGSLENLGQALRERMKSIQEIIVTLREELMIEVSLWRKDRDEFQLLRERKDALALEEATAAARAAAEAYASESPLSNELGNVVLNPMQSLSDLTILEYEKKLAKYQDALALAQAEKRYNMRRNLIAETYRRRLVEVERLCNDELEKIRESTNILQPLRQIASQWTIQNDENHGDTNREWNSTIMSQTSEKYKLAEVKNSRDRDTSKNGNAMDAEVNMIPELVAARFFYTESSKYELHDPSRKPKGSQSHLLMESNSLPSNWYAPTTDCRESGSL